MCSRQCELRIVVVKDGALPLHRGVAQRAILRETGSRVIGTRRCRVVGQMAAHTRGAQPGELAIHVTGRAGHRNMSAHQREFRRRVIEGCRSPRQVGMTGGTIRGETGRHVVWRFRRGELTHVAARAGGV